MVEADADETTWSTSGADRGIDGLLLSLGHGRLGRADDCARTRRALAPGSGTHATTVAPLARSCCGYPDARAPAILAPERLALSRRRVLPSQRGARRYPAQRADSPAWAS